MPPQVALREPLHQALLQTRRSRRDFERNAALRHLVPAPLRSAALPWFQWQALTNSLSVGAGHRMSLEDLYEVLTQTPLRTLPLWMLGTSAEEQRLAGALPESQHADLQVQNILARGALASRDYAHAARLFRDAYEVSGQAPLAHLAMFALCMGGDLEQASSVAQRLVRDHEATVLGDAQWRWFASTFGLADPRRP
jgi:hypothetical protein